MTRNDIKAQFPEATKEQIDAILDINSNDVGKAMNKGQGTQEQLENRISVLNEQIKTLNEQVTSLNGQIADKEKANKDLSDQLAAAKANSPDTTELNERIKQLTKDVADRDATIANNSKQYRIKNELRGMKAKNVDIIWPLLNLDKITEKDGKLEGLEEQIKSLRESDSYLFDTNVGDNRGGFANGNPDVGSGMDANAAINAAIRSMRFRT